MRSSSESSHDVFHIGTVADTGVGQTAIGLGNQVLFGLAEFLQLADVGGFVTSFFRIRVDLSCRGINVINCSLNRLFDESAHRVHVLLHLLPHATPLIFLDTRTTTICAQRQFRHAHILIYKIE